MNKRKDRVISINKLAKYIISHCAFVCICLVAGAALFVGLCHIKNSNNDNLNEPSQEVDYDVLYNEFTSEEKINIDYAIYSYERLKDVDEYIVNSLYMKIDAYNVEQKCVLYKIELKSDEKDDLNKQEKINALIYAYDIYVNQGGLVEDLIKENSYDDTITSEYLQEIVYIGYNSELDEGGSIYVGTYAEKLVPGLLEQIKLCMNNKTRELNTLANHKLIDVDVVTKHSKNDSIYNGQKSFYSERQAISSRLDEAVGQLSGNTLDYYNYYIDDKEKDEDVDIQININTSDGVERVSVPFKKYIKYSVFGAILGAVGACGLLLFLFMFSKKIVSEDDYVKTMGLKYIGRVKETEIDDNLAFVVTKLKLACRKKGIDSSCIVSSNSDNIEQISIKLKTLMGKQGIDVYDVADVMKDCDAMDRLFDVGSCVMIEKMGESNYGAVYDLVDLCVDNNIDILGVIDIRNK